MIWVIWISSKNCLPYHEIIKCFLHNDVLYLSIMYVYLSNAGIWELLLGNGYGRRFSNYSCSYIPSLYALILFVSSLRFVSHIQALYPLPWVKWHPPPLPYSCTFFMWFYSNILSMWPNPLRMQLLILSITPHSIPSYIQNISYLLSMLSFISPSILLQPYFFLR